MGKTWADMPTSLARLFRSGWKLWECGGRCRGCASNSGTGFVLCIFGEDSTLGPTRSFRIPIKQRREGRKKREEDKKNVECSA